MRSWIPLLWLGVVACGAEDQELYWGWPTLDDRIQSVILALRSDRAPIGDTERTLLEARAVTEARTGKVSLRFDEEPDLRRTATCPTPRTPCHIARKRAT